MHDEGHYLQFPLCALSFFDNEHTRLEHILSFGLVGAGIAMYQKLDNEIRAEKADEFKKAPGTPGDYQKTSWLDVAAMIGAKELDITVGGLKWSISRWEAVCGLRDKYQQRHGADAEVRIKTDLAFQACDKTGMSYREFAILCAVYSCIGAKQYPVRITKGTIQSRMMGYKSAKIMVIEIATRQDKAQPISLRQIGYTLSKLHACFACARPNRRETYFSHRMTQQQLEDALFKMKTSRAQSDATRRQRNLTLMDRIGAERDRLAAAINVNPLLK